LTLRKIDGKFALTIFNTPNIIVPVFSEQPQQHCLNIITMLAGQVELSENNDWRKYFLY